MEDELAVETLPWVKDILDQAGGMMASGVSAETVILAVVAVPLGLRLIQLAAPYVQTHNDDLRATIHVGHIDNLADLRQKYGPEVFQDAMAAMDAGGSLMAPSPKGKK